MTIDTPDTLVERGVVFAVETITAGRVLESITLSTKGADTGTTRIVKRFASLAVMIGCIDGCVGFEDVVAGSIACHTYGSTNAVRLTFPHHVSLIGYPPIVANKQGLFGNAHSGRMKEQSHPRCHSASRPTGTSALRRRRLEQQEPPHHGLFHLPVSVSPVQHGGASLVKGNAWTTLTEMFELTVFPSVYRRHVFLRK